MATSPVLLDFPEFGAKCPKLPRRSDRPGFVLSGVDFFLPTGHAGPPGMEPFSRLTVQRGSLGLAKSTSKTAVRSCTADRDGARSNRATRLRSRSKRKTADKTKGGPFVMTHRSFVRRLAGTAIATLLLVASAVPTMAQENKFKQVWVKTSDGLTISAQDWGN